MADLSVSDLYVYYKVRDADTAQLAPLVSVQLKRRPGNQDGLQTWMEVYPSVPAGFDAALARAVDEAGFESLLAGPRRVEVFTELPPCA
jgi:hypothetical protein